MKYTLMLIVVASTIVSGCALTDRLNLTQNTTTLPVATGSAPQESKSSNTLDLSNQNLKKVPDNVFTQTNLEELNVSNNQLTGALQAEIRKLQNLRVLNASNNQMTGVPAEIGQLQNLEILDLSNNQLTGLPNELGNLKNLKTFNISGSNYSETDLSGIIKRLPNTAQIIK
jgi:Leucine-rich repeat (LRR) protein